MPKPLPKPCKSHGIHPAIACLACRDLEIVDLLQRCLKAIQAEFYFNVDDGIEAEMPPICEEIDQAIKYLS